MYSFVCFNMLNTGRRKSKSVRLDPGRVGNIGSGDDSLDDLGPTVPLTRSGVSQRGKSDNREYYCWPIC